MVKVMNLYLKVWVTGVKVPEHILKRILKVKRQNKAVNW